jgi:hypothetical protein
MTEPTTDLTARLADALTARATTVLPDPRAYERVVARRNRRRVLRWSGVAGTAVATAAVVTLVALLVSHAPVSLPPAGRVAPAPTYAIALLDGGGLVVETATFAGLNGANPQGLDVTAVAAQGDSYHFWAAAAKPEGCHSELFGVTHTYTPGEDRTDLFNPPGGKVRGEVDAMAATSDGARLAYLLRTGPSCDTPELHVRDLHTGADRTWGFGADAQDPSLGTSLSWAPDGRHVAYTTGGREVRVLDTTAPGDDLLAPAWVDAPFTDPRPGGHAPCDVEAVAYRGLTGDLAAYVRCYGDPPQESGFVATYDPATGRPGTVLFDVSVNVARLAFDRSGDHAYVESPGSRGSADLNGRAGPHVVMQRWDRGGALRPVDTGQHRVAYGISW